MLPIQPLSLCIQGQLRFAASLCVMRVAEKPPLPVSITGVGGLGLCTIKSPRPALRCVLLASTPIAAKTELICSVTPSQPRTYSHPSHLLLWARQQQTPCFTFPSPGSKALSTVCPVVAWTWLCLPRPGKMLPSFLSPVTSVLNI